MPSGGGEPHVRDADLAHRPADLAGQRAGPQPDRVADLERPGEQQHQAREHVRQRLLRRDAHENAGERSAEEQLPDRDAEEHERDEQGGDRADEHERVPDDRRVGRPATGWSTSRALADRPIVAALANTQNATAVPAATTWLTSSLVAKKLRKCPCAQPETDAAPIASTSAMIDFHGLVFAFTMAT